MDSKNDRLPNDDPLLAKYEPIDVDFIKEEKVEDEEYFIVPGIVESASLEVDEHSVKEEVFVKGEIGHCSSPNVWIRVNSLNSGSALNGGNRPKWLLATTALWYSNTLFPVFSTLQEFGAFNLTVKIRNS